MNKRKAISHSPFAGNFNKSSDDTTKIKNLLVRLNSDKNISQYCKKPSFSFELVSGKKMAKSILTELELITDYCLRSRRE